jgi:hypothetical protein
MPQTRPWHSVRKDDRMVFHDNTTCTEGNNIEARYRREGTDGRPKCKRCAELDAAGR